MQVTLYKAKSWLEARGILLLCRMHKLQLPTARPVAEAAHSAWRSSSHACLIVRHASQPPSRSVALVPTPTTRQHSHDQRRGLVVRAAKDGLDAELEATQKVKKSMHSCRRPCSQWVGVELRFSCLGCCMLFCADPGQSPASSAGSTGGTSSSATPSSNPWSHSTGCSPDQQVRGLGPTPSAPRGQLSNSSLCQCSLRQGIQGGRLLALWLQAGQPASLVSAAEHA